MNTTVPSGIQPHSRGAFFPLVVALRGTPDGRYAGVIVFPNGEEKAFGPSTRAAYAYYLAECYASGYIGMSEEDFEPIRQHQNACYCYLGDWGRLVKRVTEE